MRRALALAVITAVSAGAPVMGQQDAANERTAGDSGPYLATTSDGITLKWKADSSNTAIVEVTGLKSRHLDRLAKAEWTQAQWQSLLSVYAEQGDPVRDMMLPPMLGNYRVSSDVIEFQPQFPLEAGVVYRAVFRPQHLPGNAGSKAAAINSVFGVLRKSSTPSTIVSAVFPSADVLPENLLKFYVHFSAPMSRGRIYDHIRLNDEKGAAVELPFLEIDEELWDSTMTRLTLFIDPGRIKQGVQPLEEIGPALVEGKRFSLVIDSAWQDASGNRLKESFRKDFTVGAPDREPIDPQSWKINPPAAGSRQPLTVLFPESLDHALALHRIRVSDASRRAVEGKAKLENHEQTWQLVPNAAWSPGAYSISVPTIIEDLAGNNIGKRFEVDLFEKVQRHLTNSVVSLPFTVR